MSPEVLTRFFQTFCLASLASLVHMRKHPGLKSYVVTEDAGEYKFVPPTPGHLNQQTASEGSVRGLKRLGMLPQSSGIYQLKLRIRREALFIVYELVFQWRLDRLHQVLKVLKNGSKLWMAIWLKSPTPCLQAWGIWAVGGDQIPLQSRNGWLWWMSEPDSHSPE